MSADFNMLISPDFSPDKISGWFMFSTWLQKKLGKSIHIIIPNNREEFFNEFKNKNIDLVYCNPFDSSELVRNLNFISFAKPKLKNDEVVIAVKDGSPIKQIEDLKNENLPIVAATENFDVNMIGLRMIEPSNLTESTIQMRKYENYPAVARSIIKGESLFGFFLAEIFHNFSNLTKKQLQIIVESQISDIHHVVLVNSKTNIFSLLENIKTEFINFGHNNNEKEIGESLGISSFEEMPQEETEFMIDLIETLKD